MTNYSYDRTAATAILPWGTMVHEWMSDVVTALSKGIHEFSGGKLTGVRASSAYGVFATIDDVEFSGDLGGTLFVNAEWSGSSVWLGIWADHPQRGRVTIWKGVDVAYDMRPDTLIGKGIALTRKELFER
jgi:hypothetical protein